MTTKLFAAALGIASPWYINGVDFDVEKKTLNINVDFVAGSRFVVPDVEGAYSAHDTVTKRYRHLNFFQHECYLEVRVPRVRLPDGGIRQVEPDWAGRLAGFTLLFEALIMMMCREMPFAAVSRLVGLSLSLIHISLDDVDLVNAVITVRDTKFFKTRQVPTGPKLTVVLSSYVQCRCQKIPMPASRGSAVFAITRSGTCASVCVAEALFDRVRNEAGLRRDGDTKGQPRLHDLRHTMVQHHLIAWYRSGSDVQRLLPQLATYLGHVDISSTQHYLTMTPELLQEANQRFERYARPEHDHA